MRRAIFWAAAGLVALAGLAAVFLSTRAADPALTAVAEGREVYAQHCAACHGANLEGQPDWRSPLPTGRMPAPPHDRSGHTWHHSDEVLFTIVRDGFQSLEPNYQTDMPIFAGVLTDEEIRSVLEFIKSTWPRRERDVQAGRTLADRR